MRLIDFFWHMALVPLVACGVLRTRDVRLWLLAVGFSVSWFADAVAILMGGSWAVVHFYPSVQLGWIAYAFGSVLVPFLLFTVPYLPPYDRPDVLATILGSVFVVYASWGTDMGLPMLLYFGLGSVLYLALLSADDFMRVWYPYQLARTAGIGAFCWRAYAR